MKKSLFLLASCMLSLPALALVPAGNSRRAMATSMITSAPRASSVQANNVQSAPTVATTGANVPATLEEMPASASVQDKEPMPQLPPVDMREKEKQICLSNNIGIGNTFVWASRYSNTNNYSSMIEDLENPENNTCFVKVDVKSLDSKISVSDVPSQYFEMGRNITCGAWGNTDALRERILDATKSSRTWTTVAGTVGGAAIGVGSMELFGNKLIGGAVQGQKDLEGDELLKSQILALKKDSPSEYNNFMRHLRSLKTECESTVWNASGAVKPDACEEINYEYLLSVK